MPSDSRSRLVAAAAELFATKGYGATSIADILSRTQLNSGSLYHFFPGKQDVLNAVLDAYRDGIGPMLLEPAWQHVADPVERIFALLASYRNALVVTECTFGCPIGSLALELHEPDPVVRNRLAENFSAWTYAVAECAAAAGLPEPEGLAEFVLAVMEGGVMLARTYRDIAHFDRAIARLRRHFELLEREEIA